MSATAPQFERDVQPILARHCLECHGGKAKKSGLDLHDAASILKGGQEGAAIVAGAADKSLLIERVSDGSMPPEGHAPMPAGEVKVLRDWINSLAAADKRWRLSLPPRELSPEDTEYWAFLRRLFARPFPTSKAPRPGSHADRRVHPKPAGSPELSLSPDADRFVAAAALFISTCGGSAADALGNGRLAGG